MRRLGDPVSALVLLGLARANMAALSDEERAADGLQPESSRRPVRRSALATQLGLPAETVRRRLMELEQRGYCRAVRGGLMISIEFATRSDSLQLLQANQGNLVRFLSRLRLYGLLDLWDAEQAADD
jgi:DNA-binding transcriptional MocR family regulator